MAKFQRAIPTSPLCIFFLNFFLNFSPPLSNDTRLKIVRATYAKLSNLTAAILKNKKIRIRHFWSDWPLLGEQMYQLLLGLLLLASENDPSIARVLVNGATPTSPEQQCWAAATRCQQNSR